MFLFIVVLSLYLNILVLSFALWISFSLVPAPPVWLAEVAGLGALEWLYFSGADLLRWIPARFRPHRRHSDSAITCLLPLANLISGNSAAFLGTARFSCFLRCGPEIVSEIRLCEEYYYESLGKKTNQHTINTAAHLHTIFEAHKVLIILSCHNLLWSSRFAS